MLLMLTSSGGWRTATRVVMDGCRFLLSSLHGPGPPSRARNSGTKKVESLLVRFKYPQLARSPGGDSVVVVAQSTCFVACPLATTPLTCESGYVGWAGRRRLRRVCRVCECARETDIGWAVAKVQAHAPYFRYRVVVSYQNQWVFAVAREFGRLWKRREAKGSWCKNLGRCCLPLKVSDDSTYPR